MTIPGWEVRIEWCLLQDHVLTSRAVLNMILGESKSIR